MRITRLATEAATTISRKASMAFGRFGVGASGFNVLDEGIRHGLNWPHLRNTQIDYRVEVGDLTQSSLVMAAVAWAGRTLPQARFCVYDLRGKHPQPVPRHPLAWRLRRPNPHFPGGRLLKASALSWILSGNVYWFKARDQGRGVRELWWLPHWLVTPRRERAGDFVSYYEYRIDGELHILDPADVIHFRDGVDPADDMRGLSPLRSALRQIFTDSEYEQYSALLARNGGVPPYAIIPKYRPGVRLNARQIKDQWMRRAGGDERGKPMILTGDVEILKLGFTPADLDLSKLRRVSEERLAGVAGIPALVLGFGAGLDRSTSSNFAAAVEQAYRGFAVPFWEYFASELSAQLLTDYDGPMPGDQPAREVRADLSRVRALQRGEDAMHRRLNNSFRSGWIKRSEARAAAGLRVDPLADDLYFPEAR